MTTAAEIPEPARVPALPSVVIGGQCIHAVSETEAIGHILSRLAEGQGGWVITPNLDHLRRCRVDRVFAGYYRQASLIVADGMPLVWAAKLQGTPLPQRVAGSSLIWTLSAAAAGRVRSIFLLGGDPGTAEAAGQILTARYPELKVAGTACPAYGFEKDSEQLAQLRQQLAASQADIVYVALGSPKQEQVIALLRDALPQAWWLGVGISFSFVAGKVKRAPRWMQRLGLEWVHRLIQEPRRLARRYLVDGLPFALVLMGGALMKRIRSTKRRDGADRQTGTTEYTEDTERRETPASQ